MSSPAKLMHPRLGFSTPVMRFKQGRFAGAVRTDHGAYLALLDLHRYVVDRDEAAEAAGQLIELQQRHGDIPALLRFCGENGRG